MYKQMLNSVVKISMMSAKYFEYYTITLRGPLFRGHTFFWRISRQNSNGVTPNGCAKFRWGRLNADAVAENWELSTRSVVNLARSQVYHTERLPTGTCLQRVARVCQRHLILVISSSSSSSLLLLLLQRPNTGRKLLLLWRCRRIWRHTSIIHWQLYRSSLESHTTKLLGAIVSRCSFIASHSPRWSGLTTIANRQLIDTRHPYSHRKWDFTQL